MIDNERRLYGYIFKRIGVKGIFHHLAFKIGLTQEDKFVYMSKHYYERMAEENYEEELKQWYYAVTGRSGFYVTHPETYNDKIQWLKLYDMSSQKTQLADKYLVREWVAQKIGKKYIIPMYGVWESFSDIKFDRLPNKFVLKCNHGSANNVIVNNKLDINYITQTSHIKNGICSLKNQYFSSQNSAQAAAELHSNAFCMYFGSL